MTTTVMAHLAVPSDSPHPTPGMDGAQSLYSDSSDTDSEAPLPFPAALPRSDFLIPDFHPASYLSALPHRHQTLEDLRSDLRDRSATISSELVELVNSNYTAFLSLGSELKGGDDKVQDVKMALLGFRRAVEEVKSKVAARRDESKELSDELKDIRVDIELGRKMLDLSERLSDLEERLSVESLSSAVQKDWDSDSNSEEEDDDRHTEGLLGSPPSRLLRSAKQCGEIIILKESLDQQHAFVIKMEERLTRCRNTLLLDLSHALKEAKRAGVDGQDRLLKCLAIYRLLDAHEEAIKALKGG